MAGGADIDLIELRTLKPPDLETIGMSLRRTHKVKKRKRSCIMFLLSGRSCVCAKNWYVHELGMHGSPFFFSTYHVVHFVEESR